MIDSTANNPSNNPVSTPAPHFIVAGRMLVNLAQVNAIELGATSRVAADTNIEAAAERIEPTAGTLRAVVLEYVRNCGEIGATDEEMQIALEMNPSTQRPRRQELEKMGFIRRMDRFTRPTRSGRSAVIFIAMEAQ